MSKMPVGKRFAAAFISSALLLMPIITGATVGNGIPKNVQIVIKMDLRQKNILQENILEELSRGLTKELTNETFESEETKDNENFEKMSKKLEDKKAEVQKLMKEIAQNSPLFTALQFPEDMTKIFDGEKPMVFVEMTSTEEQWKKLLELKSDKFEKAEYKEQTYYFYDETYFTFFGGLYETLLIANKKESMETAIDGVLEGNTLTKNTAYTETAATFLANDFISIYINPPTLGKLFSGFMGKINTAPEKAEEAKNAEKEALKEMGEASEKGTKSYTPKEQNLDYLEKILNAAKTFGASLAEEKSGIQMNFTATYDKEKLKGLGFNRKESLYTPSLYKKSPVEKPIFYYEMFNLAEAWKMQKGPDIQGISMNTIFEEMKKEFKKKTGLNLEKDIINLLDGEIVLIAGEQKNLIPSVSLMTDVKNNPERAKKTLKILKEALEKELKKNKHKKNAIWQVEEKNIAGGEGYKFSIDAPEELKNQDPMIKTVTPIKFSFGVTGENILYISTDEALEKNYSKGIKEKNILKSMNTKENPEKKSIGRFYLGIKNMASWFKQMMTATHKNISEGDRKYFNLNEVLQKTDEVAAPWEDLIIYGTGTETSEEGTLFVHVNTDSLNESYLGKITEWGRLFNENETHYENYTAPGFEDVDEKAWYHEEVKDARVYGITKGYEDNTFRGEREVTRAEFLAMAMRSVYEEKSTSETNIFYKKTAETDMDDFKDVSPAAWYYQTIQNAKNKGVINGYSDNTFHPDEPISRAEAAEIIKNILEKSGVEIGFEEAKEKESIGEKEIEKKYPFSDIPKDQWYSNAVMTNNRLGIMKGGDDGTFAPLRNLNRAESATLMIRLRNVLEEEAGGVETAG